MAVSLIVLTACVVVFTTAAAAIDLRWRRLPNWLTVSSLIAALIFHAVIGYLGVTVTKGVAPAVTRPAENAAETVPAATAPQIVTFSGVIGSLWQLGWALLGFATGFSILFVLWLIGGGGGGDAKLMGALGAWLLPFSTLQVFVFTYVIILTFMIGLIVWSAISGKGSQLKKAWLSRGKTPKGKATPWHRAIPYAVPVALATWTVLTYNLVKAASN